jgi:FPC/CPF motif-containing protein YcgG
MHDQDKSAHRSRGVPSGCDTGAASEGGCGWRPRLFSTEQMNLLGERGSLDWRVVAFREVLSTLSYEHFPCPFAQKSAQLGSQWFTFVESIEPGQLEALRLALLDYVHVARSAAGRHRLLLPLVVLVRPVAEPLSLAEYQRLGWRTLQYLHDHDVADWPVDVPPVPDHHLWSFCFAGAQLFVNFSSPAHRERRSRNLGGAMAFVINPRQNFDVVAGNNPEGQAVRRRVRARIAAYDGVAHGEELGTYGDVRNREWRQYATPEAGAPALDACPLRLRGAPS